MINWHALRSHMPDIVEHLLDMMTEDALATLIDGPADQVVAWPAVELGYTTREGERFKVRLSIEQCTEEAAEAAP